MVIRVPLEGVFERFGSQHVYVIEDGVAQRRAIVLGPVGAGFAEIRTASSPARRSSSRASLGSWMARKFKWCRTRSPRSPETRRRAMSIPAFAVRQPVLVNLVAISTVLVGALVMGAMHRESLPTMPTGWGNVTTVYVGASPEEIEQLVTIPVENAVGDVDKVEEIWSSSKEGVSYVSFHFDADVEDITSAMMEVSNEINRIDDLPIDAERPVVREVKVDFPTIAVAIRGEVPEVVLRQVGKDMADRIERLPGCRGPGATAFETVNSGSMSTPTAWPPISFRSRPSPSRFGFVPPTSRPGRPRARATLGSFAG